MSLPAPVFQESLLPDPDLDHASAQANLVTSQVSLQLLQAAGKTARSTQKRLSQTFTLYAAMLAVTFLTGIGGFLAALWSGFARPAQGTEAVATTIVFGELSAISFVSFFLSRPTEGMRVLGAQTAWLLSIVNTYWTKLAYFNDPRTAVKDLNEAQRALERSFVLYLSQTQVKHDIEIEPAAETTPPTTDPEPAEPSEAGPRPPEPAGSTAAGVQLTQAGRPAVQLNGSGQ